MSDRIEIYRDLKVYKMAFDLQKEIFKISMNFSPEERYSITDQIRRASRSIDSNIAEAWHKRRYCAHFVSKLTDSDGENAETEHWIETAFVCKYISTEVKKSLLSKTIEIGKMPWALLSHPEEFCRERV